MFICWNRLIYLLLAFFAVTSFFVMNTILAILFGFAWNFGIFVGGIVATIWIETVVKKANKVVDAFFDCN